MYFRDTSTKSLLRRISAREDTTSSQNMETLYSIPFAVLECPNIKLKKPSWLHMPSAMTVYAVVIVSYFLITGGKGSANALTLSVHTVITFEAHVWVFWINNIYYCHTQALFAFV